MVKEIKTVNLRLDGRPFFGKNFTQASSNSDKLASLVVLHRGKPDIRIK